MGGSLGTRQRTGTRGRVRVHIAHPGVQGPPVPLHVSPPLTLPCQGRWRVWGYVAIFTRMATTALHPHLAEEIAFRDGPRLWDATPGVCCAAFQLGACLHTEGDEDDYRTEAEVAADAERDAITRLLAIITAPDTCPF